MTRHAPQEGKPVQYDRTGLPLPAFGNRKKLELDPSLEPWLQQPGESPKNYGYFTMYRELGVTRNMQALTSATGRSVNYMRVLMTVNCWVDRAKAWDAEQERIFSAQMADKRKEAAKKHIRAADALIAKAMKRLEALDASKISPTVLVMMFSEAAKIHRLALGMEGPGAQTNVSVTTAAAARADGSGTEVETRVEVTTMHDQIMDGLNEMLSRMTPEQIAAGRAELATQAYDRDEPVAALPAAPPPQQ